MATASPLITVMVLCYNYGHLLCRALDAIAAQRFTDFELLFIDNGSTDNSKEVFTDFCNEHPALNARYLLVSPNQGPTHGWNLGIRQARGEYLMFHDADDWMEPDCLAALAEAARQTGADRITGQYQEVLPDGTVQRVRHFFPKKGEKLCSTMLQGVLFRRCVIQDHHITLPEHIFGPYDYYLTFRFARFETTAPVYIRQVVYNYLINPDSLCRIAEQAQNRAEGYLAIYRRFNRPLIEVTATCLDDTPDPALRQAMLYATLRNLYAALVTNYGIMLADHAQQVYRLIRADLHKAFPQYQKNRYLFPLRNGYEFSPGLVIWLVIRLEALGWSEGLLRLGSKIFFSKTKKATHAK